MVKYIQHRGILPYIMIQAGGRGFRPETLTINKPKAPVPVDNRLMIFHIPDRYPHAKFLIIADYQKDASRRYLAASRITHVIR